MNDQPSVPKPSRWLRILRNPLSRILLYVLMVVAISWLLNRILPKTPYKPAELLGLAASNPALWSYALKSLLPIVVPYWLLAHWIERRTIDELAPRKSLAGFLTGALVGTAVLIVAVMAMALFGAYSIKGVNSGLAWVAPLLVMGLLPGITEEIMRT